MNRKEYLNNYLKENYKSFTIKLSYKSERDLITWLESKEGLKDYLTTLINDDMEDVINGNKYKKVNKHE